MSHQHHSHNKYDKQRLNLGTRALVNLARISVPITFAAIYGYCIGKILDSYAHAGERARSEARTVYENGRGIK
ncbi:MAG: hypothetical protein MUF61_02410 [archaeon]|jgi:hypothetical protein|nr:hypothetical protein [archaeon]